MRDSRVLRAVHGTTMSSRGLDHSGTVSLLARRPLLTVGVRLSRTNSHTLSPSLSHTHTHTGPGITAVAESVTRSITAMATGPQKIREASSARQEKSGGG